jgi:hypothetical protein
MTSAWLVTKAKGSKGKNRVQLGYRPSVHDWNVARRNVERIMQPVLSMAPNIANICILPGRRLIE